MQKYLFLICVVALVLLTVCLHYAIDRDGGLEVTFLDVGQGDAILLEVPSGERILIDGGPNDMIIQKLSEVMPFFVNRIDYLMLSHPHADHLNGLIDVLQRYEVRGVILTGAAYRSAAVSQFYDIIDEKGADIFYIDGTYDMFIGGVYLDFLYPFENVIGDYFENINNSSIALRVIFEGKSRVLLSGDLEHEIESELMNSDLHLTAQIMKAGHHGSKTSNTGDFLQAVSPRDLVISCGVDNKFGHPALETLKKALKHGIMIRRSDLEGTISYSFDSTRLIDAPIEDSLPSRSS